MIPEGFLKDRIRKLAHRIYTDYTKNGIHELDLLVIMNSAFTYFTDLLAEINKISETPGSMKLKIRPRFVKITTQTLNVASVAMDDVSI